MVVEHARPPVRRPVAMHSGAAVARRLVNVAPSVAGGVTFASALVVLAGWAFNVGVLKSVHPTPAWTSPSTRCAWRSWSARWLG